MSQQWANPLVKNVFRSFHKAQREIAMKQYIQLIRFSSRKIDGLLQCKISHLQVKLTL